MNELIIKTYDIDYSFIIKNYLDRELWEKEWTLFVYKDHVFTLRLNCIYTKTNQVEFQIRSNSQTGVDWNNYTWYYNTQEVRYDLNSSNIEILKKQINGAIFRLIENLEMTLIVKSSEYKEISDLEDSEKETLRKIAEEYLDNENVTNEDIRDAYIDTYVRRNRTIDRKRDEYKKSRKYNVVSDLYLVFTEITKDEKRKEEVLNALDLLSAEKLLIEVKDYMKQLETEECKEELKEKLESI